MIQFFFNGKRLIDIGVYADSTGTIGAGAAIQQCVDNTPAGHFFAIPWGNYLIDQTIQLSVLHVDMNY